MYFDVEWEHVFLRIRLHDAYRPLAVDGLDEDRLALYMLAQRLSLTAGPLRLLDGDFPDRAFMIRAVSSASRTSCACWWRCGTRCAGGRSGGVHER